MDFLCTQTKTIFLYFVKVIALKSSKVKKIVSSHSINHYKRWYDVLLVVVDALTLVVVLNDGDGGKFIENFIKIK